MIYLVAIIMSYLVGNNYLVQKKSKVVGYARQSALLHLSNLGGLGGWFCIIPAAFKIGSSNEHEIIDGFLFFGTAYAGSFLAGLVPIRKILDGGTAYTVEFLLSAMTLPINLGLTIYLFIALN